MKTAITIIILAACLISIAAGYYAAMCQQRTINIIQAGNIKEIQYRDQREKELNHRILRLEFMLLPNE
jgi:deoxycytidylate deaminase